MGTALTEKHLPLLKHIKKINNINKISLMFDNDDSGKKAILKAIEVLLSGGILPNIISFKQDVSNLGYKGYR